MRRPSAEKVGLRASPAVPAVPAARGRRFTNRPSTEATEISPRDTTAYSRPSGDRAKSVSAVERSARSPGKSVRTSRTSIRSGSAAPARIR